MAQHNMSMARLRSSLKINLGFAEAGASDSAVLEEAARAVYRLSQLDDCIGRLEREGERLRALLENAFEAHIIAIAEQIKQLGEQLEVYPDYDLQLRMVNRIDDGILESIRQNHDIVVAWANNWSRQEDMSTSGCED